MLNKISLSRLQRPQCQNPERGRESVCVWSINVELIVLDQICCFLFLSRNWQGICPNYHFLHHNSLGSALNYL